MPSKDKPYKWTTPSAAIRDEVRHWRSVSIEERVAAVELLRRVTLGIYDDHPARMERTYRWVDIAPRALPDRRSARAGGARTATSNPRSRPARRADKGKRKKTGPGTG